MIINEELNENNYILQKKNLMIMDEELNENNYILSLGLYV